MCLRSLFTFSVCLQNIPSMFGYLRSISSSIHSNPLTPYPNLTFWGHHHMFSWPKIYPHPCYSNGALFLLHRYNQITPCLSCTPYLHFSLSSLEFLLILQQRITTETLGVNVALLTQWGMGTGRYALSASISRADNSEGHST